MSGTSFTSESSSSTYTTQITENKTYIPDADYKVTFNLDGGTGVSNTTYRAGVGLTLGTPTKSGQFEFLGWTGEGITTPTKNVTIPANAVGDKSYKANWQEYYIVKWNNTADYGNYIGEDALICYPIDSTDPSKISRDYNKVYGKRIRYTAPDGTTRYANPYAVNSGIKIKKGSSLIFEMYDDWTEDAEINVTGLVPRSGHGCKDPNCTLFCVACDYSTNIKLIFPSSGSQPPYLWSITASSF